mmetsp:Transcript_35329/g.85204  ORF Transcript_35329/g.85204 Transcript_35329/m.85204 type:complete len:224 (-) Transcript_35329:73-744(-)
MGEEAPVGIHVELVPVGLEVAKLVGRVLLVGGELIPPSRLGVRHALSLLVPIALVPSQLAKVFLHVHVRQLLPGVVLVVIDEAIPRPLRESQLQCGIALVRRQRRPSLPLDRGEAVIVPRRLHIPQLFHGDVLAGSIELGEGHVSKGRLGVGEAGCQSRGGEREHGDGGGDGDGAAGEDGDGRLRRRREGFLHCHIVLLNGGNDGNKNSVLRRSAVQNETYCR